MSFTHIQLGIMDFSILIKKTFRGVNMKKILWLVLLCILPITMAELELEEIRVYVNNERYYDADESGGDIDVTRGDTIKLRVNLENNMDNTTEARLKGVIELIDDGDDIKEERSWYAISANDNEWETLELDIPSDSSRDDYDLELYIYYKYYNGTVEELKVEWVVFVEIDKEEETELELTLDELITKIDNINCSGRSGESYYDLYLACFTNNTVCQAYKKTNEEYKSSYVDCKNDRDNTFRINEKCQADYYLLNQTYNICVINRENYKSQRIVYFIIGGLILGGGIYFMIKVYPNMKKSGKMSTDREISPDTESINPDEVSAKTQVKPLTSVKKDGEGEFIDPDSVSPKGG